jgi:hypothetical protein
MPNNTPASKEQSKASAKALREFWDMGRASWAEIKALIPSQGRGQGQAKQQRDGYVYGNKDGLLKKAAERLGVNYDTLAKAWKASRLYKKKEIVNICTLVREYSARFGPTHLMRVMAVRDRDMRKALTERAIQKHWGVTRLEREIQAINNGPRRHVGRRPTIPEDEPAMLASLIALCAKWERFHARAAESLPEELEAASEGVTKAVAKLKKAAEKLLTPAGTRPKDT